MDMFRLEIFEKKLGHTIEHAGTNNAVNLLHQKIIDDLLKLIYNIVYNIYNIYI